MVIAVLSDSHYVKRNLHQVSECIQNADIILHLGDGILDLEEIVDGFSGEVFGVTGNCDFTREYPKERILDISGKKIFMTHGHEYNVKMGYNNIFYKGKEIGADIVLFGHSHLAMIEDTDGILMMNPGSVYSGYGGSGRTIGFIELEENKKPYAYIKKL